MPPEVPMLCRIVLAILDFLFFHVKLSIVLSRSGKNGKNLSFITQNSCLVSFLKAVYVGASLVAEVEVVTFLVLAGHVALLSGAQAI